MLRYKAGALRPAHDGARPETLAAANDLIRRTLAQHGLWSESGETGGPLPSTGLMDGLGLPMTLRGPHPAQPLNMPSGAAFRTETHSGPSGRRAYRHYVPVSASEGITGIVMMLHGCTQTPEDFAIGTGMLPLAEAHRLVLVFPEQARGANAQTCWNWFSKGDQRRERGEPEILAGIARKAMAEHDVSQNRVFVAGLSAGAAMAVILGENYPDVFAAVGAHSGLPYGSAHDVPSAFAAMAGQIEVAPSPPAARSVPTIVFHGDADRTVHPKNGNEIIRYASGGRSTQAIQTTVSGERDGRSFQCTLTSDDKGTVLSEHWVVHGLGHAWSGGNSAGSYADPAGPDASTEMIRFFLDLPGAHVR
jgi:poly(hydroxyalkanoate) depolymerase family esterase